MLQRYKILTVTHRQTPLKSIGDFVLKAEPQAGLEALRAEFALDEIFYLATCNRVMYVIASEADLSPQWVETFFSRINPELAPEAIQKHVQALQGEAAVSHFFEVAASIDSLVVGERQILGQMREAYDQCLAWGLTADDLRLLFQQAVVAAKDVYANTRIGEKPVSVVSLAVQKLLSMGLPTQARILLVGAGQTNALAAKFLHKYEYQRVTVFNRTLSRAQQLADLFDEGRALPLDALAHYREGFDCIVVCTGAIDPVITPELYAGLLAGEAAADKIIIDLSVPHNVAPEVVSHFEPAYIEIEDLRSLAQENMAFREQEVQRAAHLLELHLEEFPLLYRQRQLERALSRVPAEIKAVRSRALNEVFRKEVDALDPAARDLMDRMLAYMEKKCIGIPMRAAREALLG
jgi:glutamyl-tRNA reductase